MKFGLIYIIIFAFLLSACKKNNELDNKKALDRIVDRYPKMYGEDRLKGYKLTRKFYDYEDSVEMQLLETDHGSNQIILLSNYKKNSYAIPFPDNDEKSYWMFYGQEEKSSSGKTFESEMNKAFQMLSIKDEYKSQRVFNDILVTLLKCRPIFPDETVKNDRLRLLSDSCNIISKKNALAIKNGLNGTWEGGYTTFDDFSHYRIFQFRAGEQSERNAKRKFMVYETPCAIKMLYL